MWTRSRCSRPFDRRDRRKHPCDRATSPMRERSVVFPIPRAPTNIVERFGLPGPSSNALVISRSNRSRPAKNGGTIPNVGVNGLRLSSTSSPLCHVAYFCSFRLLLQISTSRGIVIQNRRTSKSFRFDMKSLVRQYEPPVQGKRHAYLRGKPCAVNEGSVGGAKVGKREPRGVDDNNE